MKQLLAIGALTVLAVSAAAQEPQEPPRQTFRSAVDLVPVDVSIVDKAGRPVTGLGAGDFKLTIDGRPRIIVSAQYIHAGDAPAAAAPPTYYSTNNAAVGGRLLMLVVDQGNIGAGRGKLVLDAASRFVSRLGPADRVGVVAIPGAGPMIDFTSNHEAVRNALPKLVGLAQTQGGLYRVGTAEAVEIHRGDPLVMNDIFSRECTSYRTLAEIEECKRRVEAEADVVYAESRERTRNSLLALRLLIERMAQTPAPKTIVFLSEGLVLESDLADVSWLGPAAARAQVSLYVVHLDTQQFDATSQRISPSRTEDMAIANEGLGMLAGMARGSVLRAGATADAAFSRLSLELSGYYLLSFSPEPGDRDGKGHKIKIQVPGRSGVEIRSRAEFVVEKTTAVTDEQALLASLRAPLLATDIGLRLATYTLQDAATGKPRVLVAADIDRAGAPDVNLALGFAVIDAGGKVVASQLVPAVDAPVRPGDKTQTYVGSVVLPQPGPHTVKLAVVDGMGKRGSVEHAFDARTTSAGQVRASDLLIAENLGAGDAGGLVPAVRGEFSSATLHGYLELSSDVAPPLENVRVVFEVAGTAEGRALDGVAGIVKTGGAPTRRTVEGAVPIGLLPPGEYVARAVIEMNGRPVSSIVRPFSIVKPLTSGGTATEPGGTGTTRTPVAFTSRIDAFDREAVLRPQVVGFFLDRMNVGAAGPSKAAPAIDAARAGRFDAAVEAVQGADDRLAAAFLGGLALYSKGELEAAAGKFREAIRLDSGFFPAVFYLGSCYAAGGRDSEAVGAWQTSLVTESDAPFIYTLLGDALLRLREVDHALDILDEAVSLWPDNDQVQLRLGTAHAMAGHRAEALNVLEPYLTRHPDDQERRFLVLRTLYEARAANSPVRSPEEDQRLFLQQAAAYEAAAGPQAPLVDQWKKFIVK